MKKFIFILALVSCNNLNFDAKTTELSKEEVGKYAYNILKNINNMSEEEFVTNFISKNEILDLGVKIKVDEDIINRIEQTTEDKWKQRAVKKMKRIRKKAIEYNINWENIEYLDVIFEEIEVDGFPSVTGDLFFTYDENKYKTSVVAFQNGDKYQLGIIEGLNKK